MRTVWLVPSLAAVGPGLGQSLCRWTYSAGQGGVCAVQLPDRGVTGSCPPPRTLSQGRRAGAGTAGIGVSSACVPSAPVGTSSKSRGVTGTPEWATAPPQTGRCQCPDASAGAGWVAPNWRPLRPSTVKQWCAVAPGSWGAGLTHCPLPRPGGDPATRSAFPSAVPGRVGTAAQAGVSASEAGFLGGEGHW